MAVEHRCHAIGCKVAVEPALLMCRAHWFKVSKPLRDHVWATYRHGQEYGRAAPSAAYCDAAQAAVRFVAEKEGRTVTGREPELRLYDDLKAAL